MENQKRKISIGFVRPEELEGNIIYVTLEGGSLMDAIVTSNKNFKYYPNRFKELGLGVREYINLGVREYINFERGIVRDYNSLNELIDDLIKQNEAKVDYSRLREGAEAWSRIKKMMKVGERGFD